jgi:two-component sensor histidine kinase
VGGPLRRKTLLTARSAGALVSVFLLAVLAIAALMIWQNYKAAITAGEARAQSSAHVVAAHLQWMIEASDQALRRIDAALDEQPIQSSANTIADISQAVGDLPAGFQYSVYDETGELRLSSVPHATGISVSDRDYFRQLEAGRQVVISQQLLERLTGQQVFIIARRIERKGRFHGVASIAIPTQKMDEFWNSVALGPFSSVGVIRSDGWLVARHPAFDTPLDLSRTPLFTTYLPRNSHGFYHNPMSPADGRARIVGYWQVDGWPLVATAGIDNAETLGIFWSGLDTQIIFGLPVIAMIIASAVWIVSLLHAFAGRNAVLEDLLERNQFLLREVHHRVKNNLQAVSALIRLQPISKEARSDMERRIAAMIAVHEQIYETDQFDQVEVAPYAERLVTEIAAAYDASVTIEMRLAPVTVDRDLALPIGMIINEVVSNAFKYAFIGRPKGHLLVELSNDDGTARLLVKDDGPGFDMAQDRKGMGSRLIVGFVAQINGSFTYNSQGGASFAMNFPVKPGFS